jgi:hypothetical protein
MDVDSEPLALLLNDRCVHVYVSTAAPSGYAVGAKALIRVKSSIYIYKSESLFVGIFQINSLTP